MTELENGAIDQYIGVLKLPLQMPKSYTIEYTVNIVETPKIKS